MTLFQLCAYFVVFTTLASWLAAIYTFALQIAYLFTSDTTKQSLDAQISPFLTGTGRYFTAQVTTLVLLLSIFQFVRIVLVAMILLRPAFKAKLEEYRAACKASEDDANPNSNVSAARGRAILLRFWIINALFGALCILDDAIYNCTEGTSIFEGAWSRFISTALSCVVTVALELLVFSIIFMGVIVFTVHRARARACHGHGQVRLEGGDEMMYLRTGTSEAPITLVAVFDEKLIEIGDGMEKFSEKIRGSNGAGVPVAAQP
ncbi:hypothetical protein D9758_014832 [Tetrapyrgos nigripes]|uniref:Uncharacterized protein n=1 Tax=Tetrapyrgos nigripes TaxID=182062 RepID=A0A8H5FF12_9AGAR|nr:hypothetical protein D9758_014832 [Tetrapyrgos nigripes]